MALLRLPNTPDIVGSWHFFEIAGPRSIPTNKLVSRSVISLKASCSTTRGPGPTCEDDGNKRTDLADEIPSGIHSPES